MLCKCLIIPKNNSLLFLSDANLEANEMKHKFVKVEMWQDWLIDTYFTRPSELYKYFHVICIFSFDCLCCYFLLTTQIFKKSIYGAKRSQKEIIF